MQDFKEIMTIWKCEVRQKVQNYLYGKKTQIFTDHESLKYYSPERVKNEVGKMVRIGEGLRYRYPLPT